MLVRVERLNLDSASFRQLREAAGGDPSRIAGEVERIVAERGKMHNPVTGSGGMLIGTVAEVGSLVRETRDVRPGQRIASLISLTLTPLRLDRVLDVDMHHGQIAVEGSAVLFESSPFAVLPEDIGERIALAALDVAGAPSRTASIVKPGDSVLLVGGGGTSGLLTLHEARKHAGPSGTVAVTDLSERALTMLPHRPRRPPGCGRRDRSAGALRGGDRRDRRRGRHRRQPRQRRRLGAGHDPAHQGDAARSCSSRWRRRSPRRRWAPRGWAGRPPC